jgi:branched-chain amino acid aminotransferase
VSVVWHKGKLDRSDAIALSPHNRGLTLGDGLFETLLAVNHVALWREAHLARMTASADALGLDFPRDEIAAAMAALLADAAGVHVLRLTLTRGAAARGLAGESGPAILIATLDAYDARLIGQPAKLATSTLRRNHASMSAIHKTLSYVDAIAAAREAASRGADDALLLNAAGHVASSTIANIFVLQGGRLLTPARDQAILPGTMRHVLLQGAPALGLVPIETTLTQQHLAQADGIFLTNALRLLRPVTWLDGKNCHPGDSQKLLDYLCAAAAEQCGADPRTLQVREL